ncbi:MAG: ABC transporter permease subunit [Clostridia bacterium]|nr:ABC transporter permease subunit [Clostridia bacterium]
MMRRDAWLRRAAVAAVYLLLWSGLARAVNQPLLLPAPGAVLARLIALLPQAAFRASLAGTLARTLLAYALGAAGALLLGLLCCRSRIADALISPLMGAVRATPVSSFIVLALVWLSASGVPVLTGVLMTLPVLHGALVTAVRGVDPRLAEMARVYGLSPVRRLRHVWLPAVRPAMIDAGLGAIGLCWKAVVAAEVIGVPARAVGSRLYEAKIYLETDSLIAWTIAVVMMSVLLEALLRRLAGRYAEVRHD